MHFLHVRFCSVSVRETELWLTCSVRFRQNGKTLLRSVTSMNQSSHPNQYIALIDVKDMDESQPIWFSCCPINGHLRAKNAKFSTLLNLKYDITFIRFYFMKPCKRAPPWKVVSYKGQYNNHDHLHKDQFRFKRGHG